MNTKYFQDDDNRSDDEDYSQQILGKRIRTQDSDEFDSKAERYSFPSPSVNFVSEKCCPEEELAKKCRKELGRGDKKGRKYFTFVLKNLEDGYLSLRWAHLIVCLKFKFWIMEKHIMDFLPLQRQNGWGEVVGSVI